MALFLLHHRHHGDECAAAFAAWSGFSSPLRHRATVGTCRFGGHEIWWELDAESADHALSMLPPFVAARTAATRISVLEID